MPTAAPAFLQTLFHAGFTLFLFAALAVVLLHCVAYFGLAMREWLAIGTPRTVDTATSRR